MIQEPHIYKLERKYNEKPGYLVPFEDTITKIKRVFFIKGFEDIEKHLVKERGNHANKVTSEWIICIQGKLDITLMLNNSDFNFTLDNDTDALYVPNETFIKMYNFSKDCILLVICDENRDKYEIMEKLFKV
jgi:oxalate decarboxylase/phosphoglucose isomerase-like protein (cupin superfamily)